VLVAALGLMRQAGSELPESPLIDHVAKLDDAKEIAMST